MLLPSSIWVSLQFCNNNASLTCYCFNGFDRISMGKKEATTKTNAQNTKESKVLYAKGVNLAIYIWIVLGICFQLRSLQNAIPLECNQFWIHIQNSDI